MIIECKANLCPKVQVKSGNLSAPIVYDYKKKLLRNEVGLKMMNAQ